MELYKPYENLEVNEAWTTDIIEKAVETLFKEGAIHIYNPNGPNKGAERLTSFEAPHQDRRNRANRILFVMLVKYLEKNYPEETKTNYIYIDRKNWIIEIDENIQMTLDNYEQVVIGTKVKHRLYGEGIVKEKHEPEDPYEHRIRVDFGRTFLESFYRSNQKGVVTSRRTITQLTIVKE